MYERMIQRNLDHVQFFSSITHSTADQSKVMSFKTSKPDRHLLRQKVCQRISVIPENWHFNSRFVLKTTKTLVFVFITEILWRTFCRKVHKF